MRYFVFILVLLITVCLAVAISFQFGSIPPVGKLLDPHHGFWQNAYSEDEISDSEIRLVNLKESVEVIYDENLIPHIFAQNEEDLFRTQGYVTAQHRLWQMEFQTMAAAGRLSEIVGERALELDRMTRRKGLTYGADLGMKFIQEQDIATFRLLEAYADGVNQYIAQMTDARMPLEYKILNYRPEPWTAYKSILLLKYMTDMLVGDQDLQYTNLRALIGEDLINRLFPEYP
ncbi:penicillin acylase family protein, partial [Rhodonellum sp.]|uniref:penicillin acylase family protein n=1 Tax=Rhodonellum sp. TaxID=2231180 RepID=UPI0027280195